VLWWCAEEIVRWVLECRRPGGGFGGSPRHDPHLLYTTSAVQILALYDRLDAVDANETAACGFLHMQLTVVSIASYA
jgi:prenyltransferase beta subunit